MDDIAQLTKIAKELVKRLSDTLPDQVDPVDISITTKIPFKVILYRDVLLWRVEELSRTSCDMYERSDLAAAVILTRSVMESVSALWYLMKLVEQGYKPPFDETIMKLVMEHKIKEAEMPEAINVLTFLDKIEKDVPGAKSIYNHLSEFAHPNWSGTSYLYSNIDAKNVLTYLHKDTEKYEFIKKCGLNCLITSLNIFDMCYRKIEDLMLTFIVQCDASVIKD